MNNLIAFGCSSTYGQGLLDCMINVGAPNPPPSQYAWPNKIAEKLNIPCINLSDTGASNLQILDTILNYKFEESDIVFIMWTFYIRDFVYNETGHCSTIRVGGAYDRDLFKTWALTHNNYDLIIRSWLNIHHAHQYLKNQGLKFYFLLNKKDDTFIKNKPIWANDISFLEYAIYDVMHEFQLPFAEDRMHPGMKCHSVFADLIFEKIRSI